MLDDIEKLFDYYETRFPWADDVLIKCLVKRDLDKFKPDDSK
jgi:hypothetical protein